MGSWRGAIDLISQENLGEDRARQELKPAAAVFFCLQDARAKNVSGHQVGCALDAPKRESEPLGQAVDQGGLAQSRRPFEQNVSISE